MKKVSIYARVSSDRQEQERTIESQLRELRAYYQKQGYKIVEEYIDNGWSGTTLDRPALDRLRNDATKGLFDLVIILSEDRLSRDEDGINAILVERELEKSDVEVAYLYETSKDPMIRGMKRLFAGYERKIFLERTRRGRLDRLRRGSLFATKPALGYDYISVKENGYRMGKYVVSKEQAELVNFIFDTYLQTGSIRMVIKILEKKGVPAPRGGKYWSGRTLGLILRNTNYIGEHWANKRKAVEGKKRKMLFEKNYKKRVKNTWTIRDKSEWILIKVPPIISKEKFIAVQELLKKNSKQDRPKSFRESQYLLSGLMRCDLCGAVYYGAYCKWTNKDGRTYKVKYYFCGDKKRKEPVGCLREFVKAKELEDLIWNKITKIITNPKIIISYITGQADKLVTDEKMLKEEQATLLKDKRKIEDKKEKLLDSYLDKAFDKKTLQNKMEKLIEQEKDISQKLQAIEFRLASEVKKSSIMDNIKVFCTLARKRVNALTTEEKKEFLRYCIDHIKYNTETREVKVIGYLPIFEEVTEKETNLERELVSSTGKIGFLVD